MDHGMGRANHIFWIPILKASMDFSPKIRMSYMLLHVLVYELQETQQVNKSSRLSDFQ